MKRLAFSVKRDRCAPDRSKLRESMVRYGGRGGIRTLETVSPPTRFPVARTRPGYATLPSVSGRRGWDSNPRRLVTSPLFESGTFNHSDTSPRGSVPNESGAGSRESGERGESRWSTVESRKPAANQKPPGGNRAAVTGTPGRIRTCGLWVRNPTLYPLSYRRALPILHEIREELPERALQSHAAGREGFEPSEDIVCPQPLSRRPHSTTLAPPQADLSIVRRRGRRGPLGECTAVRPVNCSGFRPAVTNGAGPDDGQRRESPRGWPRCVGCRPVPSLAQRTAAEGRSGGTRNRETCSKA